jgi:transcriptional regulator with XRE-family HTH domain
MANDLLIDGEIQQMADKYTIGANIRRWRKFNDIKQEVFAKQIGVSRIMLSRYENGKSKVSAQVIYKMTLCLNISFGQLISKQ